jgi:tRNA A-37 threonylcarbamoyl transferase component Bud32
LAPGDVVGAGRFAITQVLGQGAQATTFEAVDKRDGRLIALKQFSIPRAQTWKDVELAEREAEVLAALDHPLVPRYVTHFEEAGSLFLAMEKVEGETLAELRARGAFDQNDVLGFLEDAAATLAYLHGRAPPIIHRDIKPSNVIRRPDGRFALVDFGSVRHRLRPEGGSTVVGTFGYMAPEQFQGRAMPATDTYAAAATALSMLTGVDPENLPHQGLRIDVSAALTGSVDPALVRILERALEPDPDQRSRASLLELLARHPTAAGHPSTPSTGRERSRASNREKRRARRAERRESRRGHGSAKGDPFKTREAQVWLRIPPALFVVLLGLWAARIATSVVLLLVLPMLLTLLSVVFGPGLRRGALACRRAGYQTRDTLRYVADRAWEVGRHHSSRGSTERVRVEPEASKADGRDVVEGMGREVDELDEELEQVSRNLEQRLSGRHRG